MGYLITLINDNHLGAAREPEATAVDNPLTDGHSPVSVCFFVRCGFFTLYLFIRSRSRAECGETRLRDCRKRRGSRFVRGKFAEIDRRVSAVFRYLDNSSKTPDSIFQESNSIEFEKG